MTARALLMVMTTGLVVGCSSELDQGVPVPLQPLGDRQPFSYNSGFTTPQRLVIRDATAWAEVWGQLWTGPAPELPAVDFGREMILVAALGQRSTGGYSILVESAHLNAERLTVLLRQVSPGGNCSVTTALTEPVDVVRLQRTDNDVKFVGRSETRSCD